MFLFADVTLKSQQICQRGCGRTREGGKQFDVCVFFFLFRLSQSIWSLGGIRISLRSHQAWPLKPVSELEVCFMSVPRLCFHPRKKNLWRSFYRSHNVTDAAHKSGGNKVWSAFSLHLCTSSPLLSSHPSLPLFPWIPPNLFLSPTLLWTRDEAEMEYLKIAQDLDMYGVNYFLIRVSQCRFAVSLQTEPILGGASISLRWQGVWEQQRDCPVCLQYFWTDLCVCVALNKHLPFGPGSLPGES